MESWIYNRITRGAGRLHLCALLALAGAIIGGACAGFPAISQAKLTILHINDVYEMRSDDQGRGGLARVKTIVDRARALNPKALLVVSGDVLSPSMLSSFDKGESMIQALNMIGANFATIGNHDFDFGSVILAKRIAQSRFKWVSSNVLENGGQFPGTLFVETKTVQGVNVGFIGLLDPKAVDYYATPADVDVMDVAESARRAINALHQKKADIIVAITHMSSEADMALASSVPEINLILGGHDHIVVNTQTGGPLIVKSGINAQSIGQVTMTFRNWRLVAMEAAHTEVTKAIFEDKEVGGFISASLDRLEASLDAPIGESLVELDASANNSRARETNVGNFIADAMRERMKADVALLDGRMIKTNEAIKPGVITRRDVFAILPFNRILCKVKVKGTIIREALEHSFYEYESKKGASLQVSGLRLVADISQKPGSRITSAEINGEPLLPERFYTVALSDQTLKGGDGYVMFKGAQTLVGPEYGEPMIEVAQDAIGEKEAISPLVDGRIKIKMAE